MATAAAIHRSHVLAELAAMSEEDRTAVLNVARNTVDLVPQGLAVVSAPATPGGTVAPACILFSSENELTVGAGPGSRRYRIHNHPAILELAMLRQHLNLGWFLNNSAKRLFLHESTIRRRTHYANADSTRAGTKTSNHVCWNHA